VKMTVGINTDDCKYLARVWRTEVLRHEANEQVEKMLQAFVPERFVVRIEEQEHEVPGFPFAPRYKFYGTVKDSKPDGSDAHFIVSAYSRQGVLAKLLAVILDDGGFFPLT
jgi:hypothetical protein